VSYPTNPSAIGAGDEVFPVYCRLAISKNNLEFLIELRLRPAVHLPTQLRRPGKAVLARMHLDLPRAGNDDVAVLDGEAGAAAGGQVHGFAGSQVHFGVGAYQLELIAAADADLVVLGLQVQLAFRSEEHTSEL